MASRVLVCGSRDFSDVEAVRRCLSRLKQGSVVIHGAATGADTIAGEVAKELGFTVEEYPADWRPNGKYDASAGPKRNARMLHEGRPAGVYAFPSWIDVDGRLSRGTQDMVTRALRAGVTVTIFPPRRADVARTPRERFEAWASTAAVASGATPKTWEDLDTDQRKLWEQIHADALAGKLMRSTDAVPSTSSG